MQQKGTADESTEIRLDEDSGEITYLPSDLINN